MAILLAAIVGDLHFLVGQIELLGCDELMPNFIKQRDHIVNGEIVLLLLLFEEISLVRWINKSFSQFCDIFFEILRIINIIFSQKRDLQREKAFRRSHVFFKFNRSLCSCKYTLPDIQHI
jgi:hypothetical protein